MASGREDGQRACRARRHPTALPGQSPPARRQQGQTSSSFRAKGGDDSPHHPTRHPDAARRRRSRSRWAGASGVTRRSGDSPGTGGSFRWAGIPLPERDGASLRSPVGSLGRERWDAGHAGETRAPPRSIIKPPIFIPRVRPMSSITFYKLSHVLSAHVPFFFSPFCGLCVSHPPCPDIPLRPRRSYPRLLIPTISDYIKARLTNTYRLCYAQIEPPKETGKQGASDIQDAAKPPVGCQFLILRCNSAVFLLKMKRCWCPAGGSPRKRAHMWREEEDAPIWDS